MKRIIAGILIAAFLMTGCGDDELAKEAEYFAGLDPAVVEEVLENPVARDLITQASEDERESLAQGIARNFVVCRDALRVYREWVNTGTRPELAPLPMPDSPREPSHSSWDRSYTELRSRIESGEIQQLRHWLTGEGTCGQWIPAEPGNASGPTVKDVVEELA